jgi:hypothetical protein
MKLTAKLRTLLLALPLTLAMGATGCATEAADEGDEAGDEPISSVSDALSTTSCKLSRSQILASASGARRTAIERGFRWFDKSISYSQSRYYENYRTDCSGFISMCWQLGTSYTTASFINEGSTWDKLSSYSQLEPGDALVRRSNGKGHIVLFLGWNPGGDSACVLEQASTAEDMEFRGRTRSSLTGSGYRPITASKF